MLVLDHLTQLKNTNRFILFYQFRSSQSKINQNYSMSNENEALFDLPERSGFFFIQLQSSARSDFE